MVELKINKKVKGIDTTGKLMTEIKVFIEPDCRACKNVLRVVYNMHEKGLIKGLTIINRAIEPELCRKYSVLVYPAVYIDDQLIFYGEFKIEDALKYAKEVHL